MSTQFGRVTLPPYGDWSITKNSDGQVDSITGWLRADSLAETLLLRRNLRGHAGDYIAITDDSDSDIDGFYRVDSITIDGAAENVPLKGDGLFSFDASVTFVGSYATGKGQSLLNRVTAVEDHATTPSWWWAPPIGAQAVEIGDASSVDIERAGADGPLVVSTAIDADCNPTWSVSPAGLYDGACYLQAADILRVGKEVPMDPTDWLIGNGFMELRPSVYQGTSDGELQVRFHNGTDWGDWTNFFINRAGTYKVPSWNFFTVLWNQPELVIVRLQRDADEVPPQRKLHELDIALRRGGRFVSCIYKYTGTAATNSLESAETDTASRPGGASYAFLDTLISGNRVIFGTPQAFTLSGVEITMNVAAKALKFWLGAAVGDAANGTGNGPADLAQQFVGQVPERVRIVAR